MVEPAQVLPTLSRVTCLAPERRAVRTDLLHALLKLALVRIFMADGAGAVVKLVQHNFCELWCRSLFVALDARRRQMCSRQREPRFLMLRQGEC